MIVDVLIPVLGRPARVLPLVESLRSSLPSVPDRNDTAQVRELFLCTPGDEAEIAEIDRHGFRKLVMPFLRGPGDFARKTNMGCEFSDADWFFLGADDLTFHPDWLSACLRLHEATGALVIGTNDLGNPMVRRGLHATHSLVHRSYLAQGTIDEPGKMLHEGYDHNGVDVEFVETAMWRRVWAFCPQAEVEHLHWLWRKGKSDATYRLGQQQYQADQRLLRERWDLWHHREVRLMMARNRRNVVTTEPSGRRSIRLR